MAEVPRQVAKFGYAYLLPTFILHAHMWYIRCRFGALQLKATKLQTFAGHNLIKTLLASIRHIATGPSLQTLCVFENIGLSESVVVFPHVKEDNKNFWGIVLIAILSWHQNLFCIADGLSEVCDYITIRNNKETIIRNKNEVCALLYTLSVQATLHSEDGVLIRFFAQTFVKYTEVWRATVHWVDHLQNVSVYMHFLVSSRASFLGMNKAHKAWWAFFHVGHLTTIYVISKGSPVTDTLTQYVHVYFVVHLHLVSLPVFAIRSKNESNL